MAATVENHTLDEVWRELEPRLRSIYELRRMTVPEYMNSFTNVHKYCTLTNAHKKRTTEPSSEKTAVKNEGSMFTGGLLYRSIEKLVDSVLKDLDVQKMTAVRGDELLRYYGKLWVNYMFCSKVLHGICDYLNRYWIKQAHHQDSSVHTIYPLCVALWRDRIITTSSQAEISKALLDMLRRDREGELVDSVLLRQVVDNFVQVGLTVAQDFAGDDTKAAEQEGLKVYRASLECHFLDQTAAHYRAESQAFLRQNPVTDYIKRVEQRLAEEDARCRKYLHETTIQPLKKTLEQVLITEHLGVIRSEFVVLLAENKIEELACTYRLLRLVSSDMNQLHKLVEDNVRTYGVHVIAAKVATIMKDESGDVFVSTVLEIHGRSMQLLHGAFQGDKGFSIAIDKALSILVNENAVRERATQASARSGSTKVADLLARYCDALLRKGTPLSKSMDDVALEAQLDRVMVIFGFVEDKDVFQKFYSLRLARRLIEETSTSDDFEGTMVAKLRNACGFEYTHKLQRMYQDMGTSKDFDELFKQHVTNLSAGGDDAKSWNMDIHVKILTSGCWLIPVRQDMNLPTDLVRPITLFKDFYMHKQQGRRLNWVYNMTRCELKSHGFKKPYTFTCSAYQASILLMYNSAKEANVKEIEETVTKSDRKFLENVLLTLVVPKVLIVKNAESGVALKDTVFDDGTVLLLNEAYMNPKIRINLNVPIRAEVQKDDEANLEKIFDERKFEIQAAVVRTMKARKKLPHQQLLAETMQILEKRFKPSVPHIKKAIEILMGDYIERDPEDLTLYVYKA